jgi:hypothetical protein
MTEAKIKICKNNYNIYIYMHVGGSDVVQSWRTLAFRSPKQGCVGSRIRS